MRTLNRYLLLIFTFIFINIAYSQNCDNYSKHKQRMEAEKVAFITKKLDFSVEEAQKFWPIYNELEAKKTVLHKQKRELMKSFHRGFETMSDKELEASLDKTIRVDLEVEKLRVEYHEKYKKAIGVKKTALFYESEREFRRSLIRNIKNRPCKK